MGSANFAKKKKKICETSMHWGREEGSTTDLSQKTELQTPTGKAHKLLFPCQKSVDKG